jgi:8-oxo-dGTP pyrophosphatase MutT (NUDIX family)
MKWTVHGERDAFRSDWIALTLADVELPDGSRFEHETVRFPRPASGTVVHDPDRGVLLIHRHRFIPDVWDWEVPAGIVDDGETPLEAASRETLEETGWQPGPITPLLTYHPSSGSTDQVFHIFYAAGATEIGPPTDVNEASEVAWIPLEKASEMVRSGEIGNALTITGLLHVIAFGPPNDAE